MSTLSSTLVPYHALRDAGELGAEVSEERLTHRLDILVEPAHLLQYTHSKPF